MSSLTSLVQVLPMIAIRGAGRAGAEPDIAHARQAEAFPCTLCRQPLIAGAAGLIDERFFLAFGVSDHDRPDLAYMSVIGAQDLHLFPHRLDKAFINWARH